MPGFNIGVGGDEIEVVGRWDALVAVHGDGAAKQL